MPLSLACSPETRRLSSISWLPSSISRTSLLVSGSSRSTADSAVGRYGRKMAAVIGSEPVCFTAGQPEPGSAKGVQLSSDHVQLYVRPSAAACPDFVESVDEERPVVPFGFVIESDEVARRDVKQAVRNLARLRTRTPWTCLLPEHRAARRRPCPGTRQAAVTDARTHPGRSPVSISVQVRGIVTVMSLRTIPAPAWREIPRAEHLPRRPGQTSRHRSAPRIHGARSGWPAVCRS